MCASDFHHFKNAALTSTFDMLFQVNSHLTLLWGTRLGLLCFPSPSPMNSLGSGSFPQNGMCGPLRPLYLHSGRDSHTKEYPHSAIVLNKLFFKYLNTYI